jgi:hypothetical protein
LPELRIISQKLVKNYLNPWEYVNKLAQSSLFEDDTEKFLLLDQSLGENITESQLFNIFNFPLMPLLFNVVSPLIENSNFYKIVQRINQDFAELLRVIFILDNQETNKIIESLFSLSNLTQMDNLQKDNFFTLAIKKLDLDENISKNIIIMMVKNNYYPQEYPKTYKLCKSENNKLLNLLYQTENNDNKWYLYQEIALLIDPDKTLDYFLFLDHNLDHQYNTYLLKEMLIWIDGNQLKTENKLDFILNSKAWKTLSQDDFSNLIHKVPQCSVTLTRLLKETNKIEWFNRDLFHYLTEIILNNNQIENDLKQFITSPSIIEKFTHQDWLKLNSLSWMAENQFSLPFGKPLLKDQEKQELIIEAKNIIQTYNNPQQTKFLINNCQQWQLSHDQQREIITKANASACDFEIIISYLYNEDKTLINIETEKYLIKLFCQIPLLKPEEREIYENILIEVLTKQILPKQKIDLLKWWKDQSLDINVYNQGFLKANQEYLLTISINSLFNYLKLLKQYKLMEEIKIVSSLAFLEHLPQNIVNQINDYLT